MDPSKTKSPTSQETYDEFEDRFTKYVVQRKASDNRRIVSFAAQIHLTDGAAVCFGWGEYSLEDVTFDMLVNNPFTCLSVPQRRHLWFNAQVAELPTISEPLDIPEKKRLQGPLFESRSGVIR